MKRGILLQGLSYFLFHLSVLREDGHFVRLRVCMIARVRWWDPS